MWLGLETQTQKTATISECKKISCDKCGCLNAFRIWEAGFKRCYKCNAQMILEPMTTVQDEIATA